GLQPSTAYQYRIRSKCGATFSSFSAIQTFNTTALRVSDITDATGFEVQVFPNPSDGMLYFTAEMQDEVWINIYDLTGKLIYTKQKVLENGIVVQLQLTQFSDGVHLIHIVGNSFSSNQFIMLKHF
ncbi:MAG: T9SS type A sorting domain-containing protein, partial [Chitinophagales bacterium]